MADKRMWIWTARLAALLVAVVIPACNNSGSGFGSNPGILWSNTATASGAGGAPAAPTGHALWTDPNLAVPGPIGIIGIGGTEITYADADPVYVGTPEGPHPVSTSRSLDPNAEAVVNSLVQQLYKPNVNQGGGQQVNLGPSLVTGDVKLAALSRAYCKHQSLHAGANAGAGLIQLMDWCMVNTNRLNPAMYNAAGAGLTPTAAGNSIAQQATAYVAGLTNNGFGAAGYWTSGVDNYYAFTMIELINGAP